MKTIFYNKSIELLQNVASPHGFVASAENTSNYKRVWARDGVICGLAALASNDQTLIATFKKTLETLAENQHKIGTIPSNVLVTDEKTEVSYGGLAGRVDAVTWFVIGVCQYAFHQNEPSFVEKYESHIEKALLLLDAWEFNNKHLVYVPLSGNWADEYITDGYVLYDQLLRIWALKSYNFFKKRDEISLKLNQITQQIECNFLPDSNGEKFHERAYKNLEFKGFLPCSFSPAGYKTNFDAFANALVLMLNFGTKEMQLQILHYAFELAKNTQLGLIPAFWPPIFEKDEHWNLLKENCKYEFRNFPFEFHNGGSWPMVNGFLGLAFMQHSETEKAIFILEKINQANAKMDFSFYENFNTELGTTNGVPFCAWSAAAAVLLEQTIHTNFKLLI